MKKPIDWAARGLSPPWTEPPLLDKLPWREFGPPDGRFFSCSVVIRALDYEVYKYFDGRYELLRDIFDWFPVTDPLVIQSMMIEAQEAGMFQVRLR